jgi:predicted porin
MNKKLIVLAVAGAFAMPFAASAKSTVQIYGKARVGYAHIDSGDGLNSGDRIINPGGSAIGFKGTEDLGGGNAAWFQLEQTFVLDGADRSWTDRNTGIGLKGSWGLFGVGQWTTPYDRVGGASGHIGAFGATDIGGVNTIISNRFTTNGNDGGVYSFARRHKGLIWYDSPSFSGFKISGAFSDNRGKDSIGGVNTPDTANGSPRLYSLGLSYNNGPIYVAAGYEKHKDFVTDGSSDDAWTINGSYKFANIFRVGLVYEHLKYSDDTAAGGDTKRNAWGVFGDWYIGGPHSLHVEYVKANNTSGSQNIAMPSDPSKYVLGSVVANGGAGDTGASMWGVKYTYKFSKRTSIDVDYARLNQDENANYALYGGATNNVGQDQTVYGLVMTHVF